jgi:hypothetical protein
MAEPEGASAARVARAFPATQHIHQCEYRSAGLMFTVLRIRELFGALNDELAHRQIRGELYLAGGAVMCLVYRSREATKDIDALLVPSADMRSAVRTVAKREGIADDWLNDAVKGFFSEHGRLEVFEELTHLRLYVPHPGYLLAMKCLALRLGEEFQDLNDVRVLLRALDVNTVTDAEAILAQYYALERYPVRTRYVLEELLAAGTVPETN